MRLLPVIRLSIETDETTSPERQLDKIQTYARLGDHELVPITEADYDLNVSGSVSPFERPGLGPWLQDERLEMWDGLCVAKLDRLTRSLFDFVTLVSWLEARGKTLICIDPLLDLSTPAGRAFASITATFAQFERETIAARVRDAWHQLRDSGKYGGGQVPFGYRPSKLDKGWGYEPDPV
jgi:site-specific DNA recombinase